MPSVRREIRPRYLPRWGVVLVALCAALLVGPGVGTALAADSTVTYRLSGTEYGVTSTEGRFAGIATAGGRHGFFDAVVPHTPLSPDAEIVEGGRFTISGAQPVSGTFEDGGTITPTSSPSGCRNQTYAVEGPVSTARGPGSFAVTLTHYRTPVRGQCVIYFATVVGTAKVPAGPAAA